MQRGEEQLWPHWDQSCVRVKNQSSVPGGQQNQQKTTVSAAVAVNSGDPADAPDPEVVAAKKAALTSKVDGMRPLDQRPDGDDSSSTASSKKGKGKKDKKKSKNRGKGRKNGKPKPEKTAEVLEKEEEKKKQAEEKKQASSPAKHQNQKCTKSVCV